jgi:hypothetical protein
MDSATVLLKISPPIERSLAESLLSEFTDIERRYVLCDWEPATLNGGQFAEVAARIIYHIDSGNLNKRKSVDSCLKYIEDEKNNNSHSFPGRRASLHLARTIRTVYKFRSQRGAVHIDPDYSANELDSTLVIALCRWIISEVLRIFWGGSPSDIANIIREIVRYEVPAILVNDNSYLVLHTDCSVEEEVLLLLHNAGDSGLSRSEIGKSIPKSAPSVTRAIKSLTSPSSRQIIRRTDESYGLTPNGSRRIFNELASKLMLTDK